MPVRFIFGPAGAGKTYFCLEWTARQLRRDPNGPPIVLLVPEQATFQMERALLCRRGLTGYTRAKVVSFRWLAREGMAAGGGADQLLADAVREVMLQQALQALADQLNVWRASVMQSGFASRALAAIDELRDASISADELMQLSERLAAADAGSELAAKLHDLACIYRQYLSVLPEGFGDHNLALDGLRTTAERLAWLCGADLLVDGFAAFTKQQYQALLAIIQCCRRSFISLCLDGHCLDNPDAWLKGAFDPVVRTYQQLIDLFKQQGVAVDRPILLDAASRYRRRFRDSRQLAAVENALAGRDTESVPPDEHAVRVVSLPTLADEVRHAAQTILKLVRSGYRFRDIAVIVRRLDRYEHLISTTFRQYDIPFFLDVRRPANHHPLAHLVLSALRVWADNWRKGDVLAYLKTGLAGLGRRHVDQLENVVLAGGIEGPVWYEGDWRICRKLIGREDDAEQADRLERLAQQVACWREAAIEPLRRLQVRLIGRDDLADSEFQANLLIDAVVKLIDELNIPAQLAALAQGEQRKGNIDQAQVHVQVWRQMLRLIEQLRPVLQETQMTLGQFHSLLELAFQRLTVGVVPSGLDQVLVGSIERSRHPAIQAALVLGFNDGAFPTPPAEDRILTDEDRQQLPIGELARQADPEQHFGNEKFLAYIALTRPSRFLQISYPAADTDGRPLAPSRYLATIQQALDSVTVEQHAGGPVWQHSLQTGQYLRPADLAAGWLFRLKAGFVDDADRRTWTAVYNWMLRHCPARDRLDELLPAVTRTNRPQLSRDTARQLFGRPLRCSPSRLESFSRCPFQHFSRYGLNLQRRWLYRIEPVDLGLFRHQVMQHLFQRVADQAGGWSGTTIEQVRRLTEQIVDELAVQEPVFAASGKNRFVLGRVREQLADAAEVQWYAIRAGSFEPWKLELKFGRDRACRLQWSLPDNTEVELIGRVDRIDICRDHEKLFAVIDYKSRTGPVRIRDVYHGLALQLGCYVLAARRLLTSTAPGEWRCAGVLLAPLVGKIATDKGDAEDRRKQLFAAFKHTGLMDGRYLDRFEAEHVCGDHPLYGFFITKEGRIGKRDKGPVIPAEALEALTRRIEEDIRRIAEEILNGQVSVHPYRINNDSPCSQCEYLGVCRFDPLEMEYRRLDAYSKSQVLEKLEVPWE